MALNFKFKIKEISKVKSKICYKKEYFVNKYSNKKSKERVLIITTFIYMMITDM